MVLIVGIVDVRIPGVLAAAPWQRLGRAWRAPNR
jgi:hypothetical protein